MDPATVATAVGVGSKILGGVGNMISGNKAAKRQNKAWDEYAKMLAEMGVANPEDYVAEFEMLSPEQLQQFQAMAEQNIDMGDTELANVQGNPAMRDIQMQALERMNRVADEGMTIEDEVARNQILREVQTAQKGAQGAITQDMQRRGQLGSGGELAARLATQGQDYNQAAMQGEALAAERNKRALQAVLESGRMAGQMDETDYGRNAAVANARDSINKFNTQNQLGVQTRNTDRMQGASNSNVTQGNNLLFRNNDLVNTQANQRVQGTLGNIDAQNAKMDAIGKAKLGKAKVDADRAAAVGSGIAKMGSVAGDEILKRWK